MSRCALRSWIARATSSLPVPVSPVISTVLFVSATQLGASDHVLHRAAAPDDAVVVELLVALVEQVAVLRAQPLVLERAPHDDQQLVDLERLLQVVERAELHRLDGALDRRVRRHHQDLRPFASRASSRDELADQIEAGRVRHQVVDDQHVDAALGEQRAALRARCRLRRTSCPSSRSACPSVLAGFSLRRRRAARAGCRRRSRHAARARARGRGERQLDADFGAVARRGCRRDGSAQAFDDVLGDRQAEAGARALRREVRIEYARADPRASMPVPRSRTTMRTRSAARAVRGLRSAGRRPPSRGPTAAVRAANGVPGVRQDVHQGHAQSFGVGRRPSRARIRLDRDGIAGCAGARRLSASRAERVDVGGRVVEPDRPGEIEHVVDDPVQPRDFLVDVGDGLAHAAGGDVVAGAACAATP